jgi:hypothetical protein
LNLHKAFRMGAERLNTATYGKLQHEYGLAKADWDLLRQDDYWTPEQARAVRSILAEVVEICLTVAGMPPTALPGQYVAATIAILVAPQNRIVAAMKAPDTFDALAASGLNQESEIIPMEREQMISLVMAYSGGFGGEPMPVLDETVIEMVQKEAKK